MDIDGASLLAEFERAAHDWPFIAAIEAQYGLPHFAAFALGSRETNLTNEIGDGGHGNGVWQLDNRSHTIPPGFNGDVEAQCIVMAQMMHGLLVQFGNERAAYAAYNAGAGTVEYNLQNGLDVDTGTAGGDYSADVYQRRQYLLAHVTEDDGMPGPSAWTQKDWEVFAEHFPIGKMYSNIVSGDVDAHGKSVNNGANSHPQNLTNILNKVEQLKVGS